jgi:hypothetical protein
MKFKTAMTSAWSSLRHGNLLHFPFCIIVLGMWPKTFCLTSHTTIFMYLSIRCDVVNPNLCDTLHYVTPESKQGYQWKSHSSCLWNPSASAKCCHLADITSKCHAPAARIHWPSDSSQWQVGNWKSSDLSLSFLVRHGAVTPDKTQLRDCSPPPEEMSSRLGANCSNNH